MSKSENFTEFQIILLRKMFGELIAKIEPFLFLKEFELLLLLSIFEPMIFHIYALGSLLFDCTINEALCCCIVDFDRCWRLWMANFD